MDRKLQPLIDESKISVHFEHELSDNDKNQIYSICQPKFENKWHFCCRDHGVMVTNKLQRELEDCKIFY